MISHQRLCMKWSFVYKCILRDWAFFGNCWMTVTLLSHSWSSHVTTSWRSMLQGDLVALWDKLKYCCMKIRTSCGKIISWELWILNSYYIPLFSFLVFTALWEQEVNIMVYDPWVSIANSGTLFQMASDTLCTQKTWDKRQIRADSGIRKSKPSKSPSWITENAVLLTFSTSIMPGCPWNIRVLHCIWDCTRCTQKMLGTRIHLWGWTNWEMLSKTWPKMPDCRATLPTILFTPQLLQDYTKVVWRSKWSVSWLDIAHYQSGPTNVPTIHRNCKWHSEEQYCEKSMIQWSVNCEIFCSKWIWRICNLVALYCDMMIICWWLNNDKWLVCT